MAGRNVLQIVRATAAQLATYVGFPGELVVNRDTHRLHLMDGTTPGGFPVARQDEVAGLAGLIGTKLPAAFGTYTTLTAAMAELPAGRITVAKVAGQLALVANDGGQPLLLPFVTSTDLDA